MHLHHVVLRYGFWLAVLAAVVFGLASGISDTTREGLNTHGEEHGGPFADLSITLRDGVYLIEADIVADEQFIEHFGTEWVKEIDSIIHEGNLLLGELGVRVSVRSIETWESPEMEWSPSEIVVSAKESAPDSGRLLIAFTSQTGRRADGFASYQYAAIALSHSGGSVSLGGTLLAHELGHLLGAGHHKDEEECDEEGCIMEAHGYDHADSWCDHHVEIMADTLTTLSTS